MAAPTPLSAYTDGLTTTWDLALWILGGLTVAAGIAAVAYGAFLTIYMLGTNLRRRWTSHRLKRQHRASGRA